MSQNQRQALFGANERLQDFRERQLRDLEFRTMQTMTQHAQMYGNGGGPTVNSEFVDMFKTIESFASQQIDKMQRMGISGGVIRETVLGSIQQSTMDLPKNHEVYKLFSELKERVNLNIEEQLNGRMDIRRASIGMR